ncbi:MAG: 13E12 repeat family protein [Actinomycetota bacterium]|nr:13E12 repeat family protein [Actinomycetota bacterium]
MLSERVRELDTAEEVLDAVECWHAERTQRDIGIFVAAARFADLHSVDARPGRGGRILPGMERPVRLGGAGTPRVWEFAAAELAARLGKSPHAGRALVADALDVRHRLPRLWARVCAGEVPVGHARHAAQQTRELSAEAAGRVDATVATYADGRLGWSRFQTLVAGKVAEADPDRAAEAERRAAEDEFAKVGRCNDHGQKTLYVRTAAAAMIRIDATLTFYATILAALGDPDPEDRRRAKAVLILANPPQALQLLQAFATHRTRTHDTDGDPSEGEPGEPRRPDPVAASLEPFRPGDIGPDSRFSCGFDPTTLLPTVTLYLHLYARTDTGEIGPVTRWEGEGPVTTEYVRDLLGPAASFTIKPVIDLNAMAPVDGYEIPDRLREAVHLRTPADCYPWAANTHRNQQQLDHSIPYVPPDHGGPPGHAGSDGSGPPGQTGLHNLGPMTGLHHRIKTHGAWTVKQPYPGIYLWRDPHGHTYLVDHTGTRKLGRTQPADEWSGVTIEFYDDEHGVEIRDEPGEAA